MWTRKSESKDALLAAYDRAMLRSAFVSLFWSIISYKKQHGGFALKSLADKIGVHKSAPTRWFSSERPNWTVNTIADIANALDVDLEIRARDRVTGAVYAPHGPVEPARSWGMSPVFVERKWDFGPTTKPISETTRTVFVPTS